MERQLKSHQSDRPQQQREEDKASNEASRAEALAQAPFAGHHQLDPIQSIANVLNHHHFEQQTRSKQKLRDQQQATSAKFEKNAIPSSVSPTTATPTTVEESGHSSNQDAGEESKVVKAPKRFGRSLLLAADSAGRDKQQVTTEHDCGGASDSAEYSNSSSHYNATGAQQVDQGNSYLYACNEFINTSSNRQAVSTQPADTKCLKQRQHADDLRLARQPTTTTGGQEKLASSKQTKVPSSLAGGSFLKLRQSCEQLHEDSKRKKRDKDKTRLTSTSSVLVGSVRQEEQDEEEEEDDGEETRLAGFILSRAGDSPDDSRRHLTANQQQHTGCTLLHLNKPGEFDPAQLICAHHHHPDDNPNHLRQYLQIEENFNSYKAAGGRKSRLRASAGRPGESAGIAGCVAGGGTGSNEQLQEQHQIRVVSGAGSSFLTCPRQAIDNQQQLNQQQAINLSSSSLSSSTSSLANLTNYNQLLHQQDSAQHLHQANIQHQSGFIASPRGYFQFLSRLAPTISLGRSGAPKMFAANGQLGVGQPGAYYVTNSSQPLQQHETSSQIMQQQQQQQHTNQRHLQQHMHQMQQHHHQHTHQMHLHQQQQHQHSYPVTSASSSSLGSSGAFASSAVRRTTGWLRDFCSKRCLMVTCLMVILFIFILVTSLSAYLNFLISANKVNLQPVSGRLRVMLDAMDEGGGGAGPANESQAAEMRRQLLALLPGEHPSNLTKRQAASGQQFLLKQRDFETILRGALDRTQPMLKTYPNHLVKLEVYSFKPASVGASAQQPSGNNDTNSNNNDLWVYFRLFLNKRSLQQDQMLMKRKSPDEQFERQFLPRLTQQTLLNGFEQLITSFGSPNAADAATPAAIRQKGASPLSSGRLEHQLGINSRRFGPHHQQVDEALQLGNAGWSSRRSSRSASTQTPTSPGGRQQNQAAAESDGNKLRSFDEQISRLMHLIGAIDLQSIYVTPEFDMIQTMPQLAPVDSGSQIMSETLRANQPIIQTTTTPASAAATSIASPPGNSVMLATGSAQDRYETVSSGGGGGGGGNIEANNNNKLVSSTTAPNGKLTSGRQSQTAGDVNPAASSPKQSAKAQFFLDQSYRANTTRPSQLQPTTTTTTTASTTIRTATATSTTTTTRRPASAGESPFLTNQRQKPGPSPAGNTSQSSAAQVGGSQSSTGPTGVVQLISGQPVVSQGSDKLVALVTADNNSRPQQGLFAPLSKAGGGGGGGSNSSTVSSISISIPELWQSAFDKQKPPGGKPLNNAPEPGARPRLITVTTIGNLVNSSAAGGSVAPADSKHLAPSEWHKISVLEQAGGSSSSQQPQQRQQAKPIRAQSNASPSGDLIDGARPTTTTTSTTRPPKVAPHLNLGGSLISSTQKPAESSAVLLSRDLLPAANNSSGRQNDQPALSQAQRNPVGQKPLKQRQPAATTSPKSTRKPAKIKKVATGAELDSTAKSDNRTSDSSKPVVSSDPKGIRIVDNFLTSIGSPSGNGPANKTLATARATELTPSTPAVTTLPSANIELTRSSVAGAPSAGRATTPRTAGAGNIESDFVIATQQARPGTSSFSGQWRPLSGSTTSSPAPITETELPIGHDFWASTSASQRTAGSNSPRPRAQRPNGGNLSLILPTEKLPATLNQATGSQSPFSMPSLMMSPQAQPPVSHFSTRFRSVARDQQQQPRTTTPGGNDFESRRVSRMRQSQTYSHRTEDFADPFGNAAGSSNSLSSTTTTSSSSTTTTTSTTSSSLADVAATPANARIVDDFLITTPDQPLDEGRTDSAEVAATMAPETFDAPVRTRLPGGGPLDAETSGPTIISLALPKGLKRTRGPFAFETLRSFGPPASPTESSSSSESVLSPSAHVAPVSPFGAASAPLRSERAPREGASSLRSIGQHDDEPPMVVQEKLLLRKRLSIGDESFEPSAVGSVAESEPENSEEPSPSQAGRGYGIRRQQSDGCPQFGCRSRANSNEFVCLNSSQICDDSVDCADETDELDCVSLLKLDPKLNRMGFSNGAGIIYLNRRGVLAPMCLDDHRDELQQQQQQWQSNQLIKQINAIGQYACNLQSFSQLVSIKINHHDLVDGSNSIRSSRQFHRLALAAGEGGDEPRASTNRLHTRSLSLNHNGRLPLERIGATGSAAAAQVTIATSDDCPSQRTVFVKCGGFECGRDYSPGTSTSGAQTNGRQLVNDFPWLVKLFHEQTLACQGYLIDESWLVAPAECFDDALTSSPAEQERRLLSWSAEISREHHANQFYKSIESNRRQLRRILVQPPQWNERPSEPSIVLAELDRPVRFSPLNRPICLPTATKTMSGQANMAKVSSNSVEPAANLANFSHCLTASLRVAPDSEGPPTQIGIQRRLSHQAHSHQLVLSKVELAARLDDCFWRGHQEQRQSADGDKSRQLICATSPKESSAKLDDETGREAAGSSDDHLANRVARVLICSQSIKASDLESAPKLRWAFVGTQLMGNEQRPALRPGGQLFVSAADQFEWIVDTMREWPERR